MTISDKFGLIPCSAEIDGERKGCSSSTQMGFIENCLSAPYRGNTLTVIGVDDVETRAQTLAAAIFMEAISRHLKNPSTYPHIPLWHAVYGGWYDRLRDASSNKNEAYQQMVGKFGMLFLTNVADNSTKEKLEKVRDLLSLYSQLPRVVVFAGGDPLQWCREQLFIRPGRVIYLGNRRSAPKKIKV